MTTTKIDLATATARHALAVAIMEQDRASKRVDSAARAYAAYATDATRSEYIAARSAHQTAINARMAAKDAADAAIYTAHAEAR